MHPTLLEEIEIDRKIEKVKDRKTKRKIERKTERKLDSERREREKETE